MVKQSKRHSSSARPSPARAAKQKDSGDQPKIPCKTVKKAILKSIAEQVDFQVDNAKSAGESTYGIANAIIRQFKESQPWLNRNLYSHYVKTNKPPRVITVDTSIQVMSSLDSEPIAGAAPSTEVTKVLQKGGRPKGSTNKNIAELATRIIKAKNHAAVEFGKVKSETCGKKRVRKGSLDSIIEEAREKFNLPTEVKLNKKTIRSRFKPAHKIRVAH